MAYQINLTGQEIDERLQNIGTAEDVAAADGTLYARISKNADDVDELRDTVGHIDSAQTATGNTVTQHTADISTLQTAVGNNKTEQDAIAVKVENNAKAIGKHTTTLKEQEKKLSSGTLRDLYISAGAVYNEQTGYYELNGLTDITEEQMRVIYKYAGTPQVRGAFAYSKARTNLPMPGMYNGSLEASMFYGSKNLEVVYLGYRQLSPSVYDEPSAYVAGTNSFYLCQKLKKIYGKIACYLPNFNWDLTFGECLALEEVRIALLNSPIKLQWSPNLSKESVLYMITNANPQSGAAAGSIAITLHPTAYARLKDDADIVAALEAKGGVITLVSA